MHTLAAIEDIMFATSLHPKLTNMSSITRRLIPSRPPDNPNLPAGAERITIAPISLWPISIIPSVHTFPGHIDIDRLEEAISTVTALWPTVAGRYVRDGDLDPVFAVSPTSRKVVNMIADTVMR
jgi:hypothetical protein